jgi:DNA-directed RNA polymerase specialized sigma24 family protein
MSDFNQFNIEKIMSGDQKEIKLLYVEINPWLMHRTNYNEELVNDIFMKILNNIDKYDKTRSKFHNFIFNVSKNHILDCYRMEERKKIEFCDLYKKPTEEHKNDEAQLDYLFFNSEKYQYDNTDFDEEIVEPIDLKLNLIYKHLAADDAQFIVSYLKEKKSKPLNQRKKYLKIIKKLKKDVLSSEQIDKNNQNNG